eukprot:4720632-Pyramimonas_sp.AAC.1
MQWPAASCASRIRPRRGRGRGPAIGGGTMKKRVCLEGECKDAKVGWPWKSANGWLFDGTRMRRQEGQIF